MMQAIRRATRKEIQQNLYRNYYIITERDKKYFEKDIYLCKIEAIKNDA